MTVGREEEGSRKRRSSLQAAVGVIYQREGVACCSRVLSAPRYCPHRDQAAGLSEFIFNRWNVLNRFSPVTLPAKLPVCAEMKRTDIRPDTARQHSGFPARDRDDIMGKR